MLVGRVEIRLINIVPFFLNIYFEVPKVLTLDTFGVSGIKGSLPSKVYFFYFRGSTGLGDREEGKKGGGLEREGKGPFPSFAPFSLLPPPPLFAPATQANNASANAGKTQHLIQ